MSHDLIGQASEQADTGGTDTAGIMACRSMAILLALKRGGSPDRRLKSLHGSQKAGAATDGAAGCHGARSWQMAGARHARPVREERPGLRVAPLPPRASARRICPALRAAATRGCRDEERPDMSTRARRATSNKELVYQVGFD